jgi:hypothetical protein
LYNEICTSINKPCVQFVETEGEARFKRQIPTDSEHSPTVRKVVKHVSAKNNETGESSGDHKKVKKSLFVTEETSVDKHNIACESTVSSLLNIDINLLNNTTEKKTSDVGVVIKHPNGDVIMRHVKDPNARSIVRNIALCNWKSAAFSIMKCEGLIDQLLNALNKKIANEFKTFSKLDSILKGRTQEELVAFSNKLLLEELRVHLPFWNACVKGSVGVSVDKKAEKQCNAIALATSVLARCRNAEMSAIAYRISTIFFHSGVSYEDIIRLNRLGVCMSHSRMLNLQRQMGKFFDAKVLIWKNDAEKKLSALRFLADLSCNQLARDDDDMNVDKEINLDVEAVQQYKYFSTDAHERCVEIMDETKRQLGESLNTDDVLFSAIQNLKGDDIPYYK